MPPARSICIFCGSSPHVEQRFLDVGDDMGARIAAQGWNLVYGGGSIGLMGETARAVHRGGKKVIGVIPHAMDSDEIAYRQADELIFTDTMRQRKAIMDQRSDAFVTLPGGLGTLEELIEVMTHHILNFHNKPVIVVNTDGFYNPLFQLFDHFIEHRFAKPRHLTSLCIVPDPEAAVEALHEAFANRPHPATDTPED